MSQQPEMITISDNNRTKLISCTIDSLKQKESLILITILDDSNFKMEFGASLSHTATHILEDFCWISYKTEKGMLSNSKKRILYVSLNVMYSIFDRLKLKKLCDYLKKERTYYCFNNTKEIYNNWVDYAMKECTELPIPKELGYKLDTNQYGNVDAIRAFPTGWHKTTLNVTQIKKLKIPFYKACIGFTETGYNHSKPDLVNIIPDDFSEKEQEYINMLEAKAEKEQEKLNSVELTQETIAKCLYSINKEAKRKRDIQGNCIQRAYYSYDDKYPAVHYQLHKAKAEKIELYDLKEQALRTAIRIWKLSPMGYHKFADTNRDMYVLAGYSFHINENISTSCLGEIKEEIDAKRKRGIPPQKAVILLKRFVKENSKI